MTYNQFMNKWHYDDVLAYSVDQLLAMCERYKFCFDIVNDILEDEREAELDLLAAA